MRLIKIYREWTSPGALIGHTLSEEDITIVNYGPVKWAALPDAIGKAKKLIWVAMVQGTNNLLWAGALIAGIRWPLAKIPANIQTFFLVLFGVVFLFNIYNLIKIGLARRKFDKFNFVDLKQVKGPDLAPPVIALRPGKISVPSLRRSAMFFVLAVLLNCLVVASPAYPAKIGEQYFTKTQVVAPWVMWESTEKIHYGSMIAIVAAPEVDQIYVARVTYTVHRIDFVESELEWQAWTQSRLSQLITAISNNILQAAPPDLTTSDQLPWLLEMWETEIEIDGETSLQFLRTVMIANFNSRYSDVFELLSFDIEIIHISLSDYRKEMSG